MGFASYDVARTGMLVSERGLNVTGHNISNISTPGYTKQQLIQNDLRYVTMPGLGQLGIGTDIDELRQLRDSFLDMNFRNENNTLSYWEVKKKNFEEIQTMVNEPLGSGLQDAMNLFWGGWQELSKEPDNLTTRAILRQRATQMINAFNNVGTQLSDLQKDINIQISNSVDQINDMARQIAKLNIEIMGNEVSGDHANDLRDKRNLLIDKLAKLINIDVQEGSDNQVDIAIGGTFLVTKGLYQEMTTKENVAGSGYISPAWKVNDDLVKIKGGEIKAFLEVRGEFAQGAVGSVTDGSPDGVINIDENQVIPSFKEKLNEILNVLVNQVNAVHRGGYGINNPPTTGLDFFTAIDPTRPLEMGNIQVNPAFFDLNLIATGTTPGVKGDSSNAQKMVDLSHAKLLGTAADPLSINEFYRDAIAKLGVKAQEAERMADNQSKLVQNIENKKETISGVNIDEEMASMLKYQHAYQANARMLNVIDSMMDNIVNRLGRVGI